MSISLLEAIEKWLSGESLSGYLLYDIPFIWISRLGQILQFFGGLTALAEILGKEKVNYYRVKIEKLINIPTVLQGAAKEIYLLLKYIEFSIRYFSPAYKNAINSEIQKATGKRRVNLDIKVLLEYRSVFEEWKNSNPERYEKWRRRKNQVRPVQNRLTAMFYITSGLSMLVILFYFIIAMFVEVKGFEIIVGLIVTFIFVRYILLLILGIIGYLYGGILFTFVVLSFVIVKIFLYVLIELFVFKPAVGYFTLSRKDAVFKLTAFFLIFFGFLLSFFAG